MVDDIKWSLQSPNIKFSFLLGSGASNSSGIPSGGELADKWYHELENLEGDNLKEWQSIHPGIEDDNQRARFYSEIYQRRFGHNPDRGYEELKYHMGGKFPSLGYFILAKIITETRNNIVITTNFDNLVEDAVRSFTDKTPFVAGHEQLAEYVTSHTERPIIIKLHRDLLLKPFNTTGDTSCLKDAWRDTLQNILSASYLIVLGYGGNDGSLMGFLTKLNPNKRKGIYWCIRREEDLNSEAQSVLQGQNDRIVIIKDFDEFMYSCALKMDYREVLTSISTVCNTRSHPLIDLVLAKFHNLERKLQDLLLTEEQKHKMSDTLLHLLPNTYVDVYNTINAAQEETDPRRMDEIYRKGLRSYGDNAFLLGVYAVFLERILKDYARAEEYYERAIYRTPKHADNLSNYAHFLENICQDFDKANEYYQMAIEANPQDADNLGDYAYFLENNRYYDKANEYYQKAIEVDPQDADNLGNYARFLEDIREVYDKSEELYLTALKADSNHAENLGSYARFLADRRHDYDEAQKYYLEALEIDPKHINNLRSYAIFLRDVLGEKDEAENYFKKVAQLEKEEESRLEEEDRLKKEFCRDRQARRERS